MKFVLHPEAYADLAEISDFIAQDSRDSADKFLDEIHDAIRILADFPHIGYTRPDLSSRPIRFHPVRDVLVAYMPDEKPLVVLAVLHGRRNPRVIAALLRARS